jgi:hypothetical protein
MRLMLASALLALSLAAPGPAHAQAQSNAPPPSAYRGPDTAAQRAAMDRLAPLVGRWQGEANVQRPHAMVVHQSERVERDLDGLLLHVRGTGHATAERTGAPVFQAAAIISFNERRGVYEVRSYTHEGHVTTADGEFLPDGGFRWGFVAGGPVRMRFTMSFDADTWRETGEISYDSGTTWSPTIDLALRRAP